MWRRSNRQMPHSGRSPRRPNGSGRTISSKKVRYGKSHDGGMAGNSHRSLPCEPLHPNSPSTITKLWNCSRTGSSQKTRDPSKSDSPMCHVSSRTGRALRASHTDYHWDRLCPYLVLPPCSMCCVMCRVMCRVMCYVAPFCNVLRCSDASIGIVGFVTHSRIREELESYLIYVYKLRTWEGEP
jgi:hypothetical protein